MCDSDGTEHPFRHLLTEKEKMVYDITLTSAAVLRLDL